MTIQVRTTVESGIYVVAVTGRIDSSSVAELHAILRTIVADGGERLVADFSEVDFISSASLRVLLDVLKTVRTIGGDLRLAGVREPVARIFDLTGFAGIMQMYPDVGSAVAGFEAKR